MKIEDRIRLKFNPTRVAVPSNERHLYINSAGYIVKEGPNGVEEVIGEVPSDLEVDTLQLADQSATVLAAGQVALDENGRVIVGNGTKNREVGSSSRFRIRNAVHVVAATVTGGATYQQIGVFKLRADEWILGQRAILVGRMAAMASSVYAGSAFVGIRPVGATIAGYRDTASIMGANGGPGAIDFCAFVQFKASSDGGSVSLVIDEDVSSETVIGFKTKYDASTVANVVGTGLSTAGISTGNATAVGVATDIEAYINLPQDGSFTGYIRAFADLELILL